MKKTWILFLMTILLFPCSGHSKSVVNEYFLRGQEVRIDSGNVKVWPKYLFGDVLYAWDANYHGGKLTKNEWQKVEDLLVADEHNELGLMVLSQDNNGNLLVLNRFWMGSKLHSLVKIPHADSIAAVKDQSKWEKYDLKRVLANATLGYNFAVVSDSSILVAGMLEEAKNHVFWVIDYKNQMVTALDYWPEDGAPTDWDKSLRYAKDCVLLRNGKGKFLYQNGYGPLAFIFSIDGIHVNIQSTLSPYLFTPGQRASTLLASCANDDRIYLLYRDHSSKGVKFDYDKNKRDLPWAFGNTLEVYDWDGVKQQVIHLDNYGQNIMLSENGKTLYLFSGYSEDIPNGYIYSYDISDLERHPMIDSVEIEKICEANVDKNLKKYGGKKYKGIKEGDKMVDFVLYDYDDQPHHLNEFMGKGKYTVLDFSGIGCGPCQAARPYLEKFYKQYKDKFEMITVSTDQLSEWKKKPVGVVSWHEWNDHQLARDIIREYEIKGIPTFVIIDSEGKVLSKSLSLKNFSEALKKLLPSEDIDKVMGLK